MGEWAGSGQYQTTKLNLIPVKSLKAVAVDAETTYLEQEGPIVQTTKDVISVSDQIKIEEEEPVVADATLSGGCSDNTAALVVLIMLSIVPLFVIGVFSIKIKNLTFGESQFELARFDSVKSQETPRHG